jgi:glycosyltransferase involved in cell wall biosynthesis
MNNEINYCFIGGVYNNEQEEIFNSKIGISNAANFFQLNLIEGIESTLEKNIDIFSAKFIGYFPVFHKKIIIRKEIFYKKNSFLVQVGFINLWGIKNVIREWKIYFELKKWLKRNNDRKVVICYSLHSPFLNAIVRLKKKHQFHAHIIIPDLPEYMKEKKFRNIFYNFFKKIDSKNIRKKVLFFNSFTLLTIHMKENLKINNNFVVVEGISDETNVMISPKKNKTFLYSGTLNLRYGIKKLIASFIRLNDPDCILEICGDGDAGKFVKNISNKYPNIKYYGVLSREKVRILQQQATFLINPRENNSDYTKYSFPSKIIEYMSSGTPTICYKLDGIPKEYFQFLIPISSNDPDSLFLKMKDVISSNYNYLQLGIDAQKFIRTYKNKYTQASKILKKIHSLV